MTTGPHPQRLPRSALLLVVLGAALVVRFAFWSEIRGTPLDDWHEWRETDMYTYVEQARRIVAGDWLARTPFHPYHEWQRGVAPETWLRWYGPHVFHQAPGYSYLVAAATALLPDPLIVLKAFQLVLGAIGCVLISLLARAIAGPLAGLAAGLLAAGYGPLLYLEAQILREGVAVCALLAILWMLSRHLAAGDGAKRPLFGCFGLGAAVGAYLILQETGTVLLAVAAVLLAWHHARRGVLVRVAAFAAGVAVGFSPLLARNVLVDAPPLSVSSRSAVVLVQSDGAGAPDGGMRFDYLSPSGARILERADGSTAQVLAGIVEGYHGDWRHALANWGARFAAVWQRWEIAGNTSYYFYRDMTVTLAWLPTFGLVFPLGLGAIAWVVVGAVSRRAGAGEGAATDRAAAATHATLLLWLFAIAAALSLTHPLGRLRIYVAPVFIVYAGVLLAWLVEACIARRGLRVAVLIGGIAAGIAIREAASAGRYLAVPRLADYAVAQSIALNRGDAAQAWRITERAAPWFPGEPGLFEKLAGWAQSIGDADLAARARARAADLGAGEDALRPGDASPADAR